MPTYKELLKDPQWLKKRDHILQARDNRCQRCHKSNEEVKLTIHHGYYHYSFKRAPWDYEDDTLWVLCWPCHEEAQQVLLSVHKVIARIYPFDLEAVGKKIDQDNFEWINGISAKELADIFVEEQDAENAQYSDYSLIIFSNQDLGDSRADAMEAASMKRFPGLTVEVIQDSGAPDCVASVAGPDQGVCDSIDSWCQKWI